MLLRHFSLGDMAVHLGFLLIFTGLTGIHSITTVSKVSVKAGRSISVPCLYDSQYRNHVKYLCKGYYYDTCSYAVKTNNQRSGKFSISDDRNQRIFTVTIKDLTDQDTDYWCVVEINGEKDVGRYFHLSVTRGTPSLYVNSQEIAGFIAEKTTIKCYHHTSGEVKWCRLGSSCVSGSSGSIAGTRVTIDKSVSNVFTVTMSGLRTEDSGWYWCVKGDFQMPVHLTVDEKPTTTTLATTTRLTTVSPTPEPVSLRTGFSDKASTTVHSQQDSVSLELKSLIIPLSLLIFIVMVTLFVWFMLKKNKRAKAASSAMREAEEEVTYSHIKHVRKTTNQTSCAANDVNVIYSSVTSTRHESERGQVEANGDNVIYSTLA